MERHPGRESSTLERDGFGIGMQLVFIVMETFHSNSIETTITNISNT